ncbi:hypothetical protein Cpir12675_005965 [Ceratocystis pirilliformis]|uniref:Target of rapamycin complex 2 subunit bit61 n=1 Tax=Ceratocystis pirilliformis TaxID=259994 RepID=A0ABR3YL91_9PEZI
MQPRRTSASQAPAATDSGNSSGATTGTGAGAGAGTGPLGTGPRPGMSTSTGVEDLAAATSRASPFSNSSRPIPTPQAQSQAQAHTQAYTQNDREELTIVTTRAASLDLPYPRSQTLYHQQPPQQPSATANHPSTPISAHSTLNFSRPSPLGRTPHDSLLLGSAASGLGSGGPPSTQSGSSSSTLNFPTINGPTPSNMPPGGQFSQSNSAAGHNPSNHNYNGNNLSASQIAAQAAVLHHRPSGGVHSRQRSQTVPAPGEDLTYLRGRTGPLSPPTVNLTESSAPRETPLGYNNGLLGSSAAAAAANAAFPRLNTNLAPSVIHPGSPMITTTSPHLQVHHPSQQFPPQPAVPEKKEKSRKLFSRPSKVNTKDTKERALPSPAKLGSAFSSALQRGNYSTTSLAPEVSGATTPGGLASSSAASLYSLANSSSVTIRPIEMPGSEKEKEKKHHFLSRQKNKIKDEYHLASSTSTAKSSTTNLYSFHQTTPVPTSSTFKGHHVIRKDKKTKDDKLDVKHVDPDTAAADLPPSVLANIHMDMQEAKLSSLSQLGPEDAWPYIRSKIIVVFEGEEVRVPIEDLNRIVLFHLQLCISRRAPTQLLEDLKELLRAGFMALDRAMRKTPEDRTIPELVEFWMFTFTVVLPYLQAVFLPLDLEFSGAGILLSTDQAREFWGAVAAIAEGSTTPALGLNIRGLVLTAYRDIVVLPRYDILKTIFSRLSLEFLPTSLASMALASPPPETATLSTSPPESSTSLGRLSTSASAAIFDPSLASFNSTSTTLFSEMGGSLSSSNNNNIASGSHSVGTRSRAISNVSYSSNISDGGIFRSYTPSTLHLNITSSLGAGTGLLASSAPGPGSALGSGISTSSGGGLGSLGSVREQNVEDSKQVTELVGRMLQCMSVLSSVGVGGTAARDEGSEKMLELSRLLKLNWLGRGRTGRNRRGLVGARVRRDTETSAA